MICPVSLRLRFPFPIISGSLMGTTNFPGIKASGIQNLARRVLVCLRTAADRGAALLQALPVVLGATELPPEHLAPAAEEAFRQARKEYFADTNRVKAAWEFGRACFDWAEFAYRGAEREAIARQGIAACRHALRLDSNSAPARYYLADNLGQLARSRLIGALRLVDQMEIHYLASIRADDQFDNAGAHRSLGMLYLEAPGWPASIGNKKKARHHLEKAVQLAPGYPENQLMLLEAYVRSGERARVQAQLPTVQTVLDKARRELTGDE